MSIKKTNISILLCAFFFVFISSLKAQQNDSSVLDSRSVISVYKPKLRELYFPVSCIALGSFSNHNSAIINNMAIKAERDENMPHFRTHIDDYLQYAPMLAGYGCLATGSKQNGWLYTKEIVLNELILNASVLTVKHFSKVPSVVNGSYNAFPSGHTTQAFSAATLFNDNFAKGKLWLQCLSYGSASAVGVLRILNERHWTSDVVAGAGFGILSAKISEWILTPHYYKKHEASSIPKF